MSYSDYKQRRKRRNFAFILLTLLFLAFVAVFTIGEEYSESSFPSWSELYRRTFSSSKENLGEVNDEKASVYFLDTGQSDCILITTKDKNVLIDAAERNMGSFIEGFLRSHGVKELDLIIATHPHSDHVGSLKYIVEHVGCREILITSHEHGEDISLEGYNKALAKAKQKGATITVATPGDEYILSDDATLKIIAPLYNHEELNNQSIVSMLTVGERKFLFMGDAESAEEEDILAYGTDISCDVIKWGHHGSASSVSEEFLDLASPQYAVILCGLNNDYGHPHGDTINKCEKRGITLFRTDIDGTISAFTDGKKIEFAVENNWN